MTGEELIQALEKLTPEQLKLPVYYTTTEYASPEDSMGCEVQKHIDSAHHVSRKLLHWERKKDGPETEEFIHLGY